MIEYGNYYHKEDIGFRLLDSGNYLGLAVAEAKVNNDPLQRVDIVREAVQQLFSEATERGEAKINIINHGNFKIFYVIFDYNGVVYYWWEKYENTIPFITIPNETLYWQWVLGGKVNNNCTYTLEFRYSIHPIRTYVGFSSNPTQSPLMCMGEFSNINLK